MLSPQKKKNKSVYFNVKKKKKILKRMPYTTAVLDISKYLNILESTRENQ